MSVKPEDLKKLAAPFQEYINDHLDKNVLLRFLKKSFNEKPI